MMSGMDKDSARVVYLDIETTGLSYAYDAITVIGLYFTHNSDEWCLQLVGDDATGERLLEALEGVVTIYTYNGSRFDLPFIRARLGVDLEARFGHRDLMYDCWRCNLKGGLKAVERQIGISRQTHEINGYEAVRLWWRYVNDYDKAALSALLEYNREDVANLKELRRHLELKG